MSQSSIATVVIDMLNPYDHEDGEALAAQVADRIEPMRTLIGASPLVIYANDNYDDFSATRQDLIDAALAGKHPELIEPIVPSEDALFVQKVRHSAFYESALNHLLHINEVEKLVLAGQVTEQCVLYSALDAYIRGFELVVVRDAVAPIDEELGDAALRMMAANMDAKIVDAADVF
jgi:nicotinamidase-related amidase